MDLAYALLLVSVLSAAPPFLLDKLDNNNNESGKEFVDSKSK